MPRLGGPGGRARRRECVIKTALLLGRAGLLSLHRTSLASCCAQLESGPGPGNTSAEYTSYMQCRKCAAEETSVVTICQCVSVNGSEFVIVDIDCDALLLGLK